MENTTSKGKTSLLLACVLVTLLSSLSHTWAQEATAVEYETVIHAGYYFSIPNSQLPWAQAKDACKSRGQLLASVETPEKDDILVELFSEHQHTNVTLQGNSWISATEVREGVWYWDSLEKPIYHKRWFMDGQPDDKENLNCVYLASTAMLYWRDANCSASMYYICEGKPNDEQEPTTTSGEQEPTTTSGEQEQTTTSGQQDPTTTSGEQEQTTGTGSMPVMATQVFSIVLLSKLFIS